MTRAAVYLRISQDPTGQAAGVTRQREDCIDLVAGQKWELFDTYVDNDISASSGKTRPEYRRMLKDVAEGHIDAIVAWHPDRLYRKLRDLEGLIDAIERRNVVMRTVRAGEIDLSTPTGRMLARILSATAQAEGEVKADRWMRSWRQGREQGNWAKTGSRTFGYTRSGELIPDEAEVMRQLAKDILAGTSMQAAAQSLNDRGIYATRGKLWRPSGLRTHLRNPVLAGYATLNREIVGEGNWEPLLDRDTWETLRALFDARTRERPARTSSLVGFAFCGNCGHRMISSAYNRRGKKHRTLRCPKRAGYDGCGGVVVNAEPVEEIVESYAHARLQDERVQRRLQELRATGGSTEILVEINALEQRILDIDAQLSEPGVPVDVLLRARSGALERIGELQADLSALTVATTTLVHSGGMEWPEDLGQRRRLIEVALAGHKVYVDPSEGKTNRFNEKRVRIEDD